MSLLMIPFYFTNPSYRHFLSVCSMCFQELGPSGPAQAEPPPSPELASLCVRWAPPAWAGLLRGRSAPQSSWGCLFQMKMPCSAQIN